MNDIDLFSPKSFSHFISSLNFEREPCSSKIQNFVCHGDSLKKSIGGDPLIILKEGINKIYETFLPINNTYSRIKSNFKKNIKTIHKGNRIIENQRSKQILDLKSKNRDLESYKSFYNSFQKSLNNSKMIELNNKVILSMSNKK